MYIPIFARLAGTRCAWPRPGRRDANEIGLLMNLRDAGKPELDMKAPRVRPTSLRSSDRGSLLRYMGLRELPAPGSIRSLLDQRYIYLARKASFSHTCHCSRSTRCARDLG